MSDQPTRPAAVTDAERIEALLADITPGPWFTVDQPWGDGTTVVAGNPDPHIADLVATCDLDIARWEQDDVHYQQQDRDNARFIADAPTIVRDLLAAVTATQAALAAAQREREARPTIVCLCGSTRFMDAFHEANRRLSLEGKIVLTVALVKSSVDDGFINQVTAEQATALDELHLRKIDLADEVLVLNVGGYVGPSTQAEIDYARTKGKAIRWLEATHDPA
jgi:hypothetical protein